MYRVFRVPIAVMWSWVTEVVREDVQGPQSSHNSGVLLAPPRAPVAGGGSRLGIKEIWLM